MEKINRVFDLLSDLPKNTLSDFLSEIDPIIFMMLIQESHRELYRLKDDMSTKRIDNKRLNDSGNYYSANRGGDNLYKSLIQENHRLIQEDINKEEILKEKIDRWTLSVRIHGKPFSIDYTSLKPHEKLDEIRREVGLKSNLFCIRLFKLIGPIIYFKVLKWYKFELKTIKSHEDIYKLYIKNNIDPDAVNYYPLKLIENFEKKEKFEALFNLVSNEFHTLYSEEY